MHWRRNMIGSKTHPRSQPSRRSPTQGDLELARQLQEAFLPRDYPIFPGSGVPPARACLHSHIATAAAKQPAVISFDIFSLSQTRAGIFICDVTGQGLRGAVITSVLRTLLEELRPTIHDPGSFLEALNLRLRGLLERVKKPISATAFFMIQTSPRKRCPLRMPVILTRCGCDGKRALLSRFAEVRRRPGLPWDSRLSNVSNISLLV